MVLDIQDGFTSTLVYNSTSKLEKKNACHQLEHYKIIKLQVNEQPE
jgi:hypothetical protein